MPQLPFELRVRILLSNMTVLITMSTSLLSLSKMTVLITMSAILLSYLQNIHNGNALYALSSKFAQFNRSMLTKLIC